jgi:hypothetical protein
MRICVPGHRIGQPVGYTSIRRVNGLGAQTIHGFRSALRDWAGEETSFPREIAEAALAHTIGNKVELSYRRGDALERRRELMTAWSNYCEPSQTDNVIKLTAKAQ